MKWFLKAKVNFKTPKNETGDKPFELIKQLPKKPYKYVYNFWHDYEKFLNGFQIIAMYAKKDTGKSWIGYLMIKSVIEQKKGNIIYGRLQLQEKKEAISEVFKVLDEMGLQPYFDKKLGKSYICFPNTSFTVRFVNISSYQSIRGAIGNDIALIWFDEINAVKFPTGFDGSFINILDTLGRRNQYKVLLTGNNETATNNPVLNALQLKFNWSYTGIQFATRKISGMNILGLQLGKDAFTNDNITLAEKLARNNPLVYATFYEGKSNTNASNKIMNLKEDYKENKPFMLFAINSHIFLFSYGEVKDHENNIENKKAILVKELASNYSEIIDKYPNLPFYTMDAQSDLLFKKAIILKREDAFNTIKPLNIALKNGNLFFCDFASNEYFLEYLFPMYHEIHNNKDLVNDYQKKRI